MKQQRFRSTPTFRYSLSGTSRVDRLSNVIYGVTAMMANAEALGHGVMTDMKTLETLVVMGNANPKGIRGRFGHPAMSENATGKQVQVARNFRIEGNKLVHDSHLLESARKSPVFNQDPVDFIMTVAETAPTEFGESAVISANVVWVLRDGRELEIDPWSDEIRDKPDDVVVDEATNRPVNATTELPILRPVAFHYVDFVNEGALTHDGMFSVVDDVFAGHSSEYAVQLYDLVDRWRNQYKIPLADLPAKVSVMLDKYLHSRSSEEMAKRLAARVEPPVVEMDADLVVEEELDLDGETEEGDDVATVATLSVVAPSDSGIVAGALEQAEALLHGMSQFSDEGNGVSLVEQVKAIDARLAVLESLSKQFAELRIANERMAAMLVQNLELSQVLQRNVLRLSGERVVTVPVEKNGADPLEVVQYAHPAPPAASFSSKPKHVTERVVTATKPANAVEQAILLQRQRAQRLGDANPVRAGAE